MVIKLKAEREVLKQRLEKEKDSAHAFQLQNDESLSALRLELEEKTNILEGRAVEIEEMNAKIEETEKQLAVKSDALEQMTARVRDLEQNLSEAEPILCMCVCNTIKTI